MAQMTRRKSEDHLQMQSIFFKENWREMFSVFKMSVHSRKAKYYMNMHNAHTIC